eukprot:7953621-Heterocapsa_arctica.AAC.1
MEAGMFDPTAPTSSFSIGPLRKFTHWLLSPFSMWEFIIDNGTSHMLFVATASPSSSSLLAMQTTTGMFA